MIIEMWEWPRPLDEDETASLLLRFGLKVATPKLVHEIEASRGKSHVTCFCANYTSFFLTWWDGIFSDLIISVMWINSEIWRFDKIQMKMWFLLHLHLGVYHDTNFSIQLDRTGIMKVSFGASPVHCRGQNLDVMTISCALFSFRRSNLKMVLTGGGFSLENPNSVIAVGPWWFHQYLQEAMFCWYEKICVLYNLSVVTMKPILEYFGITPRLWPLGVRIVSDFLSTTFP